MVDARVHAIKSRAQREVIEASAANLHHMMLNHTIARGGAEDEEEGPGGRLASARSELPREAIAASARTAAAAARLAAPMSGTVVDQEARRA